MNFKKKKKTMQNQYVDVFFIASISRIQGLYQGGEANATQAYMRVLRGAFIKADTDGALIWKWNYFSRL